MDSSRSGVKMWARRKGLLGEMRSEAEGPRFWPLASSVATGGGNGGVAPPRLRLATAEYSPLIVRVATLELLDFTTREQRVLPEHRELWFGQSKKHDQAVGPIALCRRCGFDRAPLAPSHAEKRS